MRKALNRVALLTGGLLAVSMQLSAASVTESFQIEGLISPASPKALAAALESGLKVKVTSINLKQTSTGWPEFNVQYDNASVKKSQIEKLINTTKDPAGHLYQVHKGPASPNKPLLDEEMKAIAMLGPASEKPPAIKSPIAASSESTNRGKNLFAKNCAKCHGLDGAGQGPAAPGMTTAPRPLWVWGKQDAVTQGYLFTMITEGRTDMPPWGMYFSDNQRWDLVNFVQTLKAP